MKAVVAFVLYLVVILRAQEVQSNESVSTVTFTGDAADKIVNHISENCECKQRTVCKVTRPVDCTDLDKETCHSGVYKIYPEQTSGFDVFCDMDTDGGGWTVFQRRLDGSVDFYQDWLSYKSGFGNLEREFWLGNEHIHQITAQGIYMLRIELEDFHNNVRYAKIDHFSVSDESTQYTLNATGFSGNAGDSITSHNGQKFSTKDKDNDIYSGNCAQSFKGAWWYSKCHSSNLNGLYLRGQHESHANGVNWKAWKGHKYSLKKTSMMMKRRF